jgi:hypothetical protein
VADSPKKTRLLEAVRLLDSAVAAVGSAQEALGFTQRDAQDAGLAAEWRELGSKYDELDTLRDDLKAEVCGA